MIEAAPHQKGLPMGSLRWGYQLYAGVADPWSLRYTSGRS
jgi:hypothetical protein